MVRERLRSAIAHVGLALQEPEQFTARWNKGSVRYPSEVWAALLSTAVLGTTTYGMTMGLLSEHTTTVFVKGAACTLAAGMAWVISLPALYVLNSLSGSRLAASTTLLAALVTVSWGGLAMLASIPINWFFTTAIPHAGFVLLVNLLVFAGVGIAMADTFQRVMTQLEPDRPAVPIWWIGLVTVIGSELFYAFNLFQFGA